MFDNAYLQQHMTRKLVRMNLSKDMRGHLVVVEFQEKGVGGEAVEVRGREDEKYSLHACT